jgi:hypothetical protein
MIKLMPLVQPQDPKPNKMIAIPAEPQIPEEVLRQVLEGQGYLLVKKTTR